MAALKEIKREIKGVQKTRQITKAMNMVAASKYRTAQARAENFDYYATKLSEIVDEINTWVDTKMHPLSAVREPLRVRLLLYSTDRGLCGGFNNNLFKFTGRFIQDNLPEGSTVTITPIGRKGRDFFRKRMQLAGELTDVLNSPDFSVSAALGDSLIMSFLQQEFDQLYLLYNQFINVAVQKPTYLQLLPLSFPDLENGEREAKYIYEPSANDLSDKLLPLSVQVQIHRCLLETVMGENGARMVAMDSATKNCDELSRSLTLKLNKARQTAITAELMDIVGGAEALSHG